MSPFPEALAVPVALVTALALLFVPGYLVCRALRLPRTWALSVAPLASWGLIALVCEVYARVGVFASLASVLLPLLGVGVLLCGVSVAPLLRRGAARTGGHATRPPTLRERMAAAELPLPSLPPVALLVALAVGLLCVSVIFVHGIGGLWSYYPGEDNHTHFGMVRALLESGRMTSFNATPYLLEQDLALDPWGSTPFYPVAWATVSALVAQVIGANVIVATNVVALVSVGIVYPLAATALVATVFPERRHATLLAAFAALLSASYPWLMLTFGLLAPNISANAIVPLEIAAFVLCAGDLLRGGQRVAPGLLFVLGGVSLGLLQPNGIFSCAVMLLPFCVARLWAWRHPRLGGGRVPNVVACVALVALFCALWTFLYRHPAFKTVVTFGDWPPFADLPKTFYNLLSLSYLGGWAIAPWQPVLAALLYLGVVRTFVERRGIWLVFSYLGTLVLVFAANYLDGGLRHLIAGFWYVDVYRLAATSAICGSPLAAWGLAWIVEGAERLLHMDERTHPALRVLPGLVICGVVGLLNFGGAYRLPALIPTPGDEPAPTAFANIAHRMRTSYDDGIVYTPEERAFVERVKATVPADALIANDPYDGSITAYSVDDLRVYERYSTGYGDAGESHDSAVIRERLAQVATDPEVAETVRRLGIRYVIKLYENPDSSSWFWYWNDLPLFGGVNDITDETPGFTVVLADGPYRLYEIDAAA